MPLKQWTVIQSKEGWHIVRLDPRRPGVRANFENIRETGGQIWTVNEQRKTIVRRR